METLKKGWKSGIETAWLLGKIIFPVTFLLTMLKYTPVIETLVIVFEPMMRWMGLPGEAAVVLVLTNVLNLYAGIGAILTLDLTVKHVFILSVMMSFSHSLLMETAITRKVGVSSFFVVSVRLGLAFCSAFLLNRLWPDDGRMAQYMLTPSGPEAVGGWGEIVFRGVEAATLGVIELSVIVIPLMMLIQWLKEIRALSLLSKVLAPVHKLLGVSEKTSVTLMAGLVFGISYGAGVIIQTAKKEGLEKARSVFNHAFSRCMPWGD